jgi:hypothetical protein
MKARIMCRKHAACRSRGGVRLKIICLGYAWAQASKAEQTESYGGDQREKLNGKQMIRFHRRTLFFPIELTSKRSFVTTCLLLSHKTRGYYVYLIQSLSAQGERYVGMTADLKTASLRA